MDRNEAKEQSGNSSYLVSWRERNVRIWGLWKKRGCGMAHSAAGLSDGSLCLLRGIAVTKENAQN